MTTFVSSPSPSPLVRFVVEGLLATIDSYRAGTLPLHRVAWELSIRIDLLAELEPPNRTLTRLRWSQRTVAHLDLASASAGRVELADDERGAVAAALDALCAALAVFTPHDPHDPLDPAGAARPTARHLVAA